MNKNGKVKPGKSVPCAEKADEHSSISGRGAERLPSAKTARAMEQAKAIRKNFEAMHETLECVFPPEIHSEQERDSDSMAAELARIEGMCLVIEGGGCAENASSGPVSARVEAAFTKLVKQLGEVQNALKPKQVPCGGCGATREDQRCIGCMHPFRPDPVPKAVRELLAALNRDGGHRQHAVGVAQAATEALAEFKRLQHALAAESSGNASNAAGRVVDDAGTGMLPNSLRGEPGEIKPCPRGPHAPGANCALCGGSGLRRICNLTNCHEYGCQGSGYCSVAAE